MLLRHNTKNNGVPFLSCCEISCRPVWGNSRGCVNVCAFGWAQQIGMPALVCVSVKRRTEGSVHAGGRLLFHKESGHDILGWEKGGKWGLLERMWWFEKLRKTAGSSCILHDEKCGRGSAVQTAGGGEGRQIAECLALGSAAFLARALRSSDVHRESKGETW